MTISKGVMVWAAAMIACAGLGYTAYSARAGTMADESVVLTSDGYGPLRIGMSRAEVDALMGPSPFEREEAGEPCQYYSPMNALDDLLVMMEDGVLTRITVMGAMAVRTPDGVALGVAMEPLKARYRTSGNWTPHAYAEPPAGYLTLWADGVRRDDHFYDGEGARGMVLESDARGRVAYIHVGTPSIQYIEGCS